MTQAPIDLATNVPTGSVRVTQVAGDVVTFDYGPDLSVADYLQRADISVGDGQMVTVNGAPTTPESTVETNSVVVVTGKVANG